MEVYLQARKEEHLRVLAEVCPPVLAAAYLLGRAAVFRPVPAEVFLLVQAGAFPQARAAAYQRDQEEVYQLVPVEDFLLAPRRTTATYRREKFILNISKSTATKLNIASSKMRGGCKSLPRAAVELGALLFVVSRARARVPACVLGSR